MNNDCQEINGQLVYTDEYGNQYCKDEMGNHYPPLRSQPEDKSGFTTYDSSQGHCGLCGRLTCRGNCFK